MLTLLSLVVPAVSAAPAAFPAVEAPALHAALGTPPTNHRLASPFDGAEVNVIFDEDSPQELSFPVRGKGMLWDVACDDDAAEAWLSTDAECATVEPGPVDAGAGPAWICLRIAPHELGADVEHTCVASSDTESWTLRYMPLLP